VGVAYGRNWGRRELATGRRSPIAVVVVAAALGSGMPPAVRAEVTALPARFTAASPPGS
jgi:hypothetical protein